MGSSYVDTLPADLLVDTAVLKADLTTPGTLEAIGGTRGGMRFRPGTTIRNVEYDGKRANVANLDRKTFMEPVFTGTIIAFNAKVLRFLEMAASGSGNTVTVKPAGSMFVIGDYHKWSCLWSRGDGGTCEVVFPYGIVTEYEIAGTDNNEGEATITIAARQRRDDAGSSDGEVPYTITVTPAP